MPPKLPFCQLPAYRSCLSCSARVRVGVRAQSNASIVSLLVEFVEPVSDCARSMQCTVARLVVIEDHLCCPHDVCCRNCSFRLVVGFFCSAAGFHEGGLGCLFVCLFHSSLRVKSSIHPSFIHPFVRSKSTAAHNEFHAASCSSECNSFTNQTTPQSSDQRSLKYNSPAS
jgi:hypothetical protein